LHGRRHQGADAMMDSFKDDDLDDPQ
jgi:hypothetical protein